MPETATNRPIPPEEIDECDPVATCHGRRGPVLFWSISAAVGMVASSLVLNYTEVSGAFEFTVAMLPVPLLAGMYWAMFRVAQSVDEMQRKMKLEALGLTVIVASLIFFALGQFERIGIYEPLDFSDDWLIITFSFMACYALVHLRYRA